MTDKNCLTYWFPRLEEAGLPVPRTKILETKVELIRMLDEPAAIEGFDDFIKQLTTLGREIGPPIFLRTGWTSGKHQWVESCFVPNLDKLPLHVCTLVETHALAGLPEPTVWVVREMLPVEQIATLPRYRNMPLVREVRAFIEDGKVLGWHPYWPPTAVMKGFNQDGVENTSGRREDLAQVLKESQAVNWPAARPLVEKVAEVFASDEAFSVDILHTKNGPYVTDMALKSASYIWQDAMRKADQDT